jgi:6-phosphogluconate dehydrogenase
VQLGMVGLGRMGGNMLERLRRGGHEVVGYTRNPEKTEVPSMEELAAALEPPRAVWTMLPAGDPTEQAVLGLADLLERDDLVVDGANSNFRDSMRRAATLRERGLHFVDAGVSGGIFDRCWSITASAFGEALKQVDVTVSWRDYEGHELTISTLVYVGAQ